MKRRRLAGVLLASSLVVAACGSGADEATGDTDDSADVTTASETTDSSEDAAGGTDEGTDSGSDADVCTEDKVGGEIVVAPRGAGAILDTIMSQTGTMSSGYEAMAIYSTLMRYDVDTATYVPHVAESLVGNEDSSVWTMKLREEVVFGNGDPLNADALIAHIDRHMAEESTSFPKNQAKPFLDTWTKVDEWTVEFTLLESYGNFPTVFAGQLGLVQNVALIEERGQEAFGQDPSGGGVGPYEVTEWAPPERIVLTAKEDWWGGPVCIEQITVTVIPDLAATYGAYTTGEVDVAYFNRDPVTLAKARSEQGDDKFTSSTFNGAFLVMPNVGVNGYEGPFMDVRVRQAMAYAIDPDVVNERAWGGVGWSGKGLVNEAAQTLEPTEGLPYDPDRARELLDEYKAETGWDGTIGAIAAATPASNKEASIVIAAQLEAVGFNVDEDFDMPVVSLITAVTADKDFELVAAWGIVYPENDLYAGVRMWSSPELGGYQNGFASPNYDAAVAEVRKASTQEEYQAALEALQVVINEEVPYQVYGADVSSTLTRENIEGIRWHRGIDPLFEYAYLVD